MRTAWSRGRRASEPGFSAGSRRGNVPWSALEETRYASAAWVELGVVPGGYGWVFPKGDHANLGVGGWMEEGPRLREHLERLARAHGVDPSELTEVRGHRLPMRDLGAPAARGRVLLVGDAAGLVDPLSGDGIYEAFVSATLASAAIVADRPEEYEPALSAAPTATPPRRGRPSALRIATRARVCGRCARRASSRPCPGCCAASSRIRGTRRESPSRRFVSSRVSRATPSKAATVGRRSRVRWTLQQLPWSSRLRLRSGASSTSSPCAFRPAGRSCGRRRHAAAARPRSSGATTCRSSRTSCSAGAAVTATRASRRSPGGRARQRTLIVACFTVFGLTARAALASVVRGARHAFGDCGKRKRRGLPRLFSVNRTRTTSRRSGCS